MTELNLHGQVQNDQKHQNHQMRTGGFEEVSLDLASKESQDSFGIVVVEGDQMDASAFEIA